MSRFDLNIGRKYVKFRLNTRKLFKKAGKKHWMSRFDFDIGHQKTSKPV